MRFPGLHVTAAVPALWPTRQELYWLTLFSCEKEDKAAVSSACPRSASPLGVQLDDPLDAIAVHAWNGTWGVLSCGFLSGTYRLHADGHVRQGSLVCRCMPRSSRRAMRPCRALQQAQLPKTQCLFNPHTSSCIRAVQVACMHACQRYACVHITYSLGCCCWHSR